MPRARESMSHCESAASHAQFAFAAARLRDLLSRCQQLALTLSRYIQLFSVWSNFFIPNPLQLGLDHLNMDGTNQSKAQPSRKSTKQSHARPAASGYQMHRARESAHTSH